MLEGIDIVIALVVMTIVFASAYIYQISKKCKEDISDKQSAIIKTQKTYIKELEETIALGNNLIDKYKTRTDMIEKTIENLEKLYDKKDKEIKSLKSKKLSNKEIKNLAYRIATSHFTQAELNYENFDKLTDEELMDISWSPFNDYNPEEYKELIENLASDIEYVLKNSKIKGDK